MALAAALAALSCAAAIGACSSDATPQPPTIGGCKPVGDASCKGFGAGGGGAPSKEPDSGEPTDAPIDVQLTDALLSCGGGTDQTITSIAAFSPACADCLATGQDAGLADCCGDATSCSMDGQCLNIVSCELTCTSGPLCCADLTPPAGSRSTYNLLAQCAGQVCAGLCPMLQHLTPGDL
jgi:hypothetical protein